MANDEYVLTCKMWGYFVVDPPDRRPGWYVDLYTQIGDVPPLHGTLYGPIPFGELERTRDELLEADKQRIEKSVEYLKRSITEQIKHDADTY